MAARPGSAPIVTTALQNLRQAVVGQMPELIGEVGRALREQWPDYAQFLVDNDTEVVASAITVVEQLLTVTDNGALTVHDLDQTLQQDLFEEIGRMQWRAGKDVTHLLSAYRTGVRVFWERASSVALEVCVELETLSSLAHAVFLFVDELSACSARGYVLEQGAAGAERERHREELVGLLLSDRADEVTVRAAAVRADWAVPDELTVVLLTPDDTAGGRLTSRLGPNALPFRTSAASGGGPRGAVVPFPTGAGGTTTMRRMLGDVQAIVGPAVGPQDLPASLEIADIAARLRAEDLLGADADGPLFAGAHLDTIIVHRDRRLLDSLRHDVLAPLENQPTAAARARMRDTLRAWLSTMGDRRAMAASLHVHPQTVRYRLAQLRELFGTDLEDPAVRARLTLALCWDS